MERRLWLELYRVVIALGKTHDFTGLHYSDACIVLVLLWAAVHDRARSWACKLENWHDGDDYLWVDLPSGSCLSRRARTVGVQLLFAQAQDALRDRFPQRALKFIDAKPLPVGGASQDRDATCGRAARGQARGYKVHAVFDAAGAVEGWRLGPMSQNEKDAARELLPTALAGSGALYVSADNQYDGNPTFDTVAAAGAQLVVQPRSKTPAGLGHRPQSPHRLRGLALAAPSPLLAPRGMMAVVMMTTMTTTMTTRTFGQDLLHARGGIERRFARISNFGGGLGPLPNWVRRPRRVALWVAAKFLIFLAYEAILGGPKITT
jgi:hypothetical protein